MKIKLLFLVLIGFFWSLNTFAQPYGNEWINYSQKYYKFKILQDGIYKVDHQTLVNSGITTSEFTSANMQIFGKDKEQPLVVFDGGDGSFDAGDYFLFYGEKNTGWLDSTLYQDPNLIGNPGYSIFNDTIYYFFTWNNSTNNLRYTAESDNNYASYTPPLSYVLSLVENFSTAEYNIGYTENGTALSLFTAGEGYASSKYNGGGTTSGFSTQFGFATPNLYTGLGAPNAIFHGKSNSNSDATATNSDNHHLKWTIGQFNQLLVDTTFEGYQQIITNRNIAPIYLSNGYTNTTFEIVNDLGALTDYQSWSYMSLYYPKTPNMNGLNKDKFWIRNNIQSKLLLEVTNSTITSPVMLVSGGNTPKYIFPTNVGGIWKALISPSGNGNDQRVIFQDLSQIILIPSFSAVSSDATFTDFSAVDFDSANIMIYHPKLDSASQLYRAYRSQSYNVVYANIEELYLQFGGGIPKHNAALRRFGLFAYNNATVKPIALTLLGKGYSTNLSKTNTTTYANSLIPAFGDPGSDICFTANLLGSGYAPLIPTGRISVNTNTELSNYLDKLKQYELQQNQSDVYDTPNKDWQKQVLHFSGGNAGYQQDLFFQYMEQFRSIIEDANFAGHVTSFRKISSDPMDPSLIGQLTEQLENGVSLMNFFGHSGASGFDITIDEPDNWNNQNKYPVVVGNGCHSGAIYTGDNSFGEILIRTPQEGAIAYIGSSDNEYDISVYQYCKELYNQFSPKNYGLPISHQIKNTINFLQNDTGTMGNVLLSGTYGATNLNGDPLLKLNWHTKPEIEITEQSIYFNPNEPTLADDSIELNLVIKNLGRSVVDTFYVEIIRDFPNSSIDSVYTIQYNALHYVDTLKLKIPTQANIATGLNVFSIKIDQNPFAIEEQYEEVSNNQIIKQLFLKFDALIPIYPYEFAVVPRDTVTVKASTVNPIGGMRKYLFELDTIHTFNSPEKRVFSMERLGGVQEVRYDQWLDENGLPKPLICSDSTVYFWRTAVDSSFLAWNESSFQYIKGKEGWGQDHFYQFKKNQFSNVSYDSLNRLRVFLPVQKTLDVTNYDNASNPSSVYFIDNMFQEYGICSYTTPIIHLVVIDPVTLNPWYTNVPGTIDGHDLLQTNCRGRQEKFFLYVQDSAGLNNLNYVLRNLIPNGFYITMYSSVYADYSAWSQWCPGLLDFFSQSGSTLINAATPENGFIFFTQIGDPSQTQEVLSTGGGEMFQLSAIMNSGQYQGYETSTLIGPAFDWKTIYWKQDPLESNIGDTTHLTIECFNHNQIKTYEIDTIFTRNDSIIDVSTIINANTYPYIKFKATYVDKVSFTPAQVDRWHVLYTPVPEAAIDGSTGYSLFPITDTINEGDEFSFAVDIKNISDYHMDSLLVSYYVENKDHIRVPIDYPRQDSLRISQILRDTIVISTKGLPGLNSLWIEVNPYINGSSVQTDQPEQYHFNNLLQIPFNVRGDDVNPILDVTFNGRHILNGDIVDPESEILITLKDDNEFLIMDDVSDTTLFGIFLTSPDGVQKRIHFTDGNGNQVLQWYPAESQFKKFKIIYPALFEQDGVYTLLVQGTDRSGNLSGDLDYKINFEVIHESSITYLMNYPNPFSTSTRFVFTLTGSEIPDEFLIQIMTVSGKVVRQINEDELGTIHIGRNITEFEWNGTDDFGDPLANGVYLYRVMTRLKGEEIKHRETDGDKFFTKEYGKMYIIR